MGWFADARLVVRDLLKAKGYTLVAVLTLGLVLCANTAVFSAVHAVLLKPKAIRQPNRLVVCWKKDQPHDVPVVELSYREFEEWAANTQSFSHAAAFGSSTWPIALDQPSGSTRLSSAGVSVSFFETLGGIPELGRTFGQEDDFPGARRVVALSHRLWVDKFGGDPNVLGRLVQLDGQPYEVIAVMSDEFDFPPATDIWTPVIPVLAQSGKQWNTDAFQNVGVLFAVGRLRDDATPAMARDELNRLVARVPGTIPVVTPLLDFRLGPVRQALWALLAAVMLLVLIGCANVSGLMLARVSFKRRDDALRRALGASRTRLARRWMLEALLVSTAGGIVGLLAAPLTIKAIVVLTPQDVAQLSGVSLNVTIFGFAFASILVTALVCGLSPIRDAAESDIVENLNDGAHASPGPRSCRTRSLLAVAQISLAAVLLVAAGLVTRSLINIRSIDLGFVPSGVLTLHITPRNPRPSANEWVVDLLRQVEALQCRTRGRRRPSPTGARSDRERHIRPSRGASGSRQGRAAESNPELPGRHVRVLQRHAHRAQTRPSLQRGRSRQLHEGCHRQRERSTPPVAWAGSDWQAAGG